MVFMKIEVRFFFLFFFYDFRVLPKISAFLWFYDHTRISYSHIAYELYIIYNSWVKTSTKKEHFEHGLKSIGVESWSERFITGFL